MRELTKAEEQIMQVLWDLKRAFVKDVREQLPDPKPAYNTVSTIIRILEKKGFVSHEAYGKTYEYFPLVSKDTYKKASMKKLIENYFSNSFKEMVSFFTKEKNLSVTEMEELILMIEAHIQKQRDTEDE